MFSNLVTATGRTYANSAVGNRAEEGVKRVVEVHQTQQVKQRALSRDKARVRQRAVTARIELGEPPVTEWRRRQQRAPGDGQERVLDEILSHAPQIDEWFDPMLRELVCRPDARQHE